jgi:chaperonin GroEL
MAKRIKHGTEAKEALSKGINTVANTVRTTLGPAGRSVIAEREIGGPMVTVDGVSVAKEINLADSFENQGAQLCIEVASRTNELAGDGTTTATVLAQAIVNEGLKYTSVGGNPIKVKKGIIKAVNEALSIIQRLAIPITTKDQTRKIAIISGKDEEIGELVSNAIDKAGKNGIISIEESGTRDTYLDLIDGFEIESGYLNPYFITHDDQMRVIYEEVNILVTDKRIDNNPELVKLLELAISQKHPFLIIADDYSPECLGTILLNKVKGGMPFVAIKAPGLGSQKAELLQDIAIMVGAEFISNSMGTKLSSIQLSQLGSAKKIIIDHNKTIILDGDLDKEKLTGKIEQLKTQIEGTESDYLREAYQERLGKLSGGVAVIRLGANTTTELHEKQHRYEDALSATKAALDEGIVAGGGVTLIRIAQQIKVIGDNKDEQNGIDIVKAALEKPLFFIAENAGYDGGVIVNEVKKLKGNKGFDAMTGTSVDMVDTGIIDPAKVTRCTIENAASIAGLVLTTESIIVNEKEN